MCQSGSDQRRTPNVQLKRTAAFVPHRRHYGEPGRSRLRKATAWQAENKDQRNRPAGSCMLILILMLILVLVLVLSREMAEFSSLDVRQ